MSKVFKFLFILIIVSAILFAIYYFMQKKQVDSISNFKQCVDAGYPVMESYPRQCAVPNGKTFTEEVEENSGIANPASVYCEENGGTLEIRTGEGGGQVGYCIFDDGSECEEWAFYNKTCEK